MSLSLSLSLSHTHTLTHTHTHKHTHTMHTHTRDFLMFAGPGFFALLGKVICYSSMSYAAAAAGTLALAAHQVDTYISVCKNIHVRVYSILYCNSQSLYIRLKFTYSVISVIVDSLPGNTKKQSIDKFVAFGVRFVHSWAAPLSTVV